MSKQSICFSCGEPCDPVADKCHGCGKIVCVKCGDRYGHSASGVHGRKEKSMTPNGKISKTAKSAAGIIEEQVKLIRQLGEALLIVSKAVEEFVGEKPKIVKGGAIANFNKWKKKNG